MRRPVQWRGTAQDLSDLLRLLESDPQLKASLRAALWAPEDVVVWLREHLPRLLREDPRLASEVVGVLARTLSPRGELVRVLEEVRLAREDFRRALEALDRRFELVEQRFRAVDERFEALQRNMDRRFEALQQEMDRRFEALQRDTDRRFDLQATALASLTRDVRRLTVGMGSLGRRTGLGFEEAVRSLVEEFAGLGPLQAERLVLHDHGPDPRTL